MSERSTPQGDRIAKVLSRAGVASRREAERMIEAGRVRVNGAPISSPALNVTETDKITVDGKPVAAPEPPRLWLYHKPTGLVSTDKDEKGRETVFDALPDDMPRVMSVGRLDLNSEGLLLLTNDGAIKRKLELPSTGWLRRYRVRVNGRPTDATLDPLRHGISADGEKFQPMEVTLDRQQGANAWLTVGLREGRNREIRRALAEVDMTVNRLIRISYGPFQLGELKSGAVEEVRRRVVRDQLGLSLDETPETNSTPRKPAKVSRSSLAKKRQSEPRRAKAPPRRK
ncbi:MAG: pseudouridine synthase [Roseobacter sp.]